MSEGAPINCNPSFGPQKLLSTGPTVAEKDVRSMRPNVTVLGEFSSRSKWNDRGPPGDRDQGPDEPQEFLGFLHRDIGYS